MKQIGGGSAIIFIVQMRVYTRFVSTLISTLMNFDEDGQHEREKLEPHIANFFELE